MIGDRADITQVARSLQLQSEMGRARERSQDVHMLWGADMWKYTPLLYELSNFILKGHNNYPKMLSQM